MIQFFRDMAENPFLVTGLIAGLLASLACGVIGPYVITRRIVFLSGAIAHMAVGGIGAAIFLNDRWPEAFGWLRPIHGAVAAAVLAAVLIGLVLERIGERLDTLIGAMWAIGMSIGILLLKYTPGYQVELMSYLFGNLAYVPWSDVWFLVGLNALIVVTAMLLHKRLLALCVDEQQAELQGINVVLTNVILLTLVALAVISLVQIVGLILVMALLTLPAATVSHHVRRLVPIMWGSAALSMLLTTVPRMAVYGTKISPESAIVIAAGVAYLISVIAQRYRV